MLGRSYSTSTAGLKAKDDPKSYGSSGVANKLAQDTVKREQEDLVEGLENKSKGVVPVYPELDLIGSGKLVKETAKGVLEKQAVKKVEQDDGLYKNLYPNHTVSLDKVPRELIQDANGRYWLKSPNGNLITPSGKYDFVTMPNGKIIVSRGNISDESTHLGLSNGKDVKYAGSIRFTDNQGGSRGKIKEWDNSSGHYKPSFKNTNQAGLPLDKLVPNVRKVK